MKYCCFIVLNLLLFTSIVGCQKGDSDYQKVSGVVTMDGNPVEKALVSFYPKDDSGIAASGVTDSKGGYVLTTASAKNTGSGTKPGRYDVTIVKRETTVDTDQEAFDKGEITYDQLQERKNEKRTVVSTIPKSELPERYSLPATSKLEGVVENKSTVINFDLVTE